jgi:hypothetical protein
LQSHLIFSISSPLSLPLRSSLAGNNKKLTPLLSSRHINKKDYDKSQKGVLLPSTRPFAQSSSSPAPNQLFALRSRMKSFFPCQIFIYQNEKCLQCKKGKERNIIFIHASLFFSFAFMFTPRQLVFPFMWK